MACILQLAEGVRINGLSSEMLLGIQIVHGAFSELGAKYCIITSVSDGEHSVGSLHYTGNAVDFRTFNLGGQAREKLERDLRDALGMDFDVVMETNPEHLHIEYQPKKAY